MEKIIDEIYEECSLYNFMRYGSTIYLENNDKEKLKSQSPSESYTFIAYHQVIYFMSYMN